MATKDWETDKTGSKYSWMTKERPYLSIWLFRGLSLVPKKHTYWEVNNDFLTPKTEYFKTKREAINHVRKLMKKH